MFPVLSFSQSISLAQVNEFNRIGWCESHGNLKAKNPNSSAKGEYQFLKGSWNYYGKELWGDELSSKDIYSTDSRELAWYVYSKYGNKPWENSRWCWSVPEST